MTCPLSLFCLLDHPPMTYVSLQWKELSGFTGPWLKILACVIGLHNSRLSLEWKPLRPNHAYRCDRPVLAWAELYQHQNINCLSNSESRLGIERESVVHTLSGCHGKNTSPMFVVGSGRFAVRINIVAVYTNRSVSGSLDAPQVLVILMVIYSPNTRHEACPRSKCTHHPRESAEAASRLG